MLVGVQDVAAALENPAGDSRDETGLVVFGVDAGEGAAVAAGHVAHVVLERSREHRGAQANAQRAFDVHAVDYVLKPVDEDRFKAAFDKARKQRANAVAAERLGELLETVRRLADGGAVAGV
jgi:CheY-like chemotaxis protein